MGMSAGSGDGENAPMATINVTPLVDVMLVLLIIFMITTPLMQNVVEVDLPKADLTAEEAIRPLVIDLAIEANGTIWWDGQVRTVSALETELRRAARQTPQPEVKVRADANLRYQTIRETLEIVKNAGIVRVGFVTTPDR